MQIVGERGVCNSFRCADPSSLSLPLSMEVFFARHRVGWREEEKTAKVVTKSLLMSLLLSLLLLVSLFFFYRLPLFVVAAVWRDVRTLCHPLRVCLRIYFAKYNKLLLI